jgi:transposase
VLGTKEAEMKIIGVDLHARQQTIAMLDDRTGELVEKKLKHEGNEVREFYSALPRPVLVGIEATGSMHWFLRLLEELKIEYCVGHPAKIRAAEPRKQKNDRRDARLLLKLLAENRFPSIWMPSCEQRDLQILLRHRHRFVRMRTRVQQTLQSLALSHGLRRGPSLWTPAGQQLLRMLPLAPHATHQRDTLLALYPQLQGPIDDLDHRVEEQAQQRCQARRLMTHPGVGPVTALATEVFLGDPRRFVDGKAVASYIGMIPSEHSSGRRQRLGRLSKQGNSLLRFLWGEAAMHAVRHDPELQRFYRRKLAQKGMGTARVAASRKLGIRLWVMLRDEIDYLEFCRRGHLRRQCSGVVCAGMPEGNTGPK